MLYELVANACKGISVFPVRPKLITSTDESTQYIFEGHKAQQDEFTLVTSESNGMRGMNALCKAIM